MQNLIHGNAHLHNKIIELHNFLEIMFLELLLQKLDTRYRSTGKMD